MKYSYVLEGVILTLLAAEMSGIQGMWALEMSLPFGLLAAMAWVIVVLIYLIVAIPAFRRKIGGFQYLLRIIALVCVALPNLIFTQQITSIPLRQTPTLETWKKIDEQFKGRIKIVSSKGACAYVPRWFDQNDVAKSIFAIDPTLNPNTTKVVDSKHE